MLCWFRNFKALFMTRFLDETLPQGVIHLGFCYRVLSSSSWVAIRMMAGSFFEASSVAFGEDEAYSEMLLSP